MDDKNVINIQSLLDIESQIAQNELYDDVKIEESRVELKMDLGGYIGDFDRHRGEKQKKIKKREPLTETELVDMMLEKDRFKEITLAFRDIDPERNGFVTQ